MKAMFNSQLFWSGVKVNQVYKADLQLPKISSAFSFNRKGGEPGVLKRSLDRYLPTYCFHL
jgi:hypothetical protein